MLENLIHTSDKLIIYSTLKATLKLYSTLKSTLKGRKKGGKGRKSDSL